MDIGLLLMGVLFFVVGLALATNFGGLADVHERQWIRARRATYLMTHKPGSAKNQLMDFEHLRRINRPVGSLFALLGLVTIFSCIVAAI